MTSTRAGVRPCRPDLEADGLEQRRERSRVEEVDVLGLLENAEPRDRPSDLPRNTACEVARYERPAMTRHGVEPNPIRPVEVPAPDARSIEGNLHVQEPVRSEHAAEPE